MFGFTENRSKGLKTETEGEERLLMETAQKDPSRFLDLYERNFDRVYAYVARRVGNRHDSEDVTSEVFHRAFENLGGFEWRGAPSAAWLYRIAANTAARLPTELFLRGAGLNFLGCTLGQFF